MERQMAEKCLIEQSKRTRVRGDGPRRNALKTFCKIGKVSHQAVSELNYILDTHSQNDIGGDNYGISQNCNYEDVFNVGSSYRQILLQALNSLFKNTYRFRLSEMKGNHELNWHIDADTSVICRAQICLNHNDSIFEFKDKEGIKSLQMQPGEVWFINTGWNHRVVSGDITRRTAIIGFHFEDLIDKETLLK
jgi:hypothetical protein